jgi:hypothetical protein
LLLSLTALKVAAQGTAFNYQGRLNVSGSPANTNYDFRFTIYDAVTNGNQISLPLTNSAVPVNSGLFNVTLDFGAGIFAGNNRWLDIGVRAIGVTNFTALFPRQPVLPVPYAIFATGASNLTGTLPATQITGTLPSAQISGTYSGAVNFSNSTNTFSGAFSGNGSTLTNLNATQLTTGTVADARLTANVALLNASQTFTGQNNFNGANNFTNRANNFTGSFFGNGLVGWVPVAGPTVQALPDTGYLLTNNTQVTVVMLPTTNNLLLGDIVRVSGAGAGGWQIGLATNQFVIGNFVSYKNSVWSASPAAAGTWNCLAASADGAVMYAGLKSATGIYASTDYGRTWNATAATATGLYGLACSSDGVKIYAFPFNNFIQYSSNLGASWTIMTSNKLNWVAGACSADGTKILGAVKPGNLYLSTNALATWNITSSGIPAAGIQNWSAVAASADGARLAAAISGGSIYVSTNTGASWNANAPTANWTDVVMSGDGLKLVATAFGGSIYTSTNGGASWTNSAAPNANWNCLAASSDCSRLVAGISNGVIYASVNFGASWSAFAGSQSNAWAALASSADGNHLAGVVNSVGGNIYYSGSAAQTSTYATTNSFISGSQGSAVELQYIGNNQFMPVSAVGTIWAN